MSIFEAVMLLCFGAGWPFSIAKSLRTKCVDGKSPAFMLILLNGYLCGIMHKIFYLFDWIIILYTVNFFLISFDLFLYYKYSAGKTQW